MLKTKICIAGIGGVGGYFGGLLANYYEHHKEVEISFIARGKHLEEIRKNGLKVIKQEKVFFAKPHIATNNASEIGIADYIILATKSYDLEAIIHQLKPCIHNNTILVPLLNGVDSSARIQNILPNNLVVEGCAYIVSRIKEYGVIENSGNIEKMYFGLDNFVNERLVLLETLCRNAGIDANLTENISSVIWEKFVFISAIATATSYFDKCIGALLADDENLKTISLLIEEVIQVANAKQINISNDLLAKTLTKLSSLPYETTTSMHADFTNNKAANELTSLTEYVIIEGRNYGVETPVFEKAFVALKMKSGI